MDTLPKAGPEGLDGQRTGGDTIWASGYVSYCYPSAWLASDFNSTKPEIASDLGIVGSKTQRPGTSTKSHLY